MTSAKLREQYIVDAVTQLLLNFYGGYLWAASTMYCSLSFADVILLQLKIAHEEPVSGKTD